LSERDFIVIEPVRWIRRSDEPAAGGEAKPLLERIEEQDVREAVATASRMSVFIVLKKQHLRTGGASFKVLKNQHYWV
jgi:hypothetical protein